MPAPLIGLAVSQSAGSLGLVVNAGVFLLAVFFFIKISQDMYKDKKVMEWFADGDHSYQYNVPYALGHAYLSGEWLARRP